MRPINPGISKSENTLEHEKNGFSKLISTLEITILAALIAIYIIPPFASVYSKTFFFKDPESKTCTRYLL